MPTLPVVPTLLGLAALASPLTAQPRDRAAPPAAPASVTPGQFAGLRWLVGTWRGRLPRGGHFYERYRAVDDSTIAMTGYRDSTFTRSTEGDRVALRGGTVRYENVVATRLDASGVEFASADGRSGFTWARAGAGGWTATLRQRDAAGRTRTVVYPMEPYPAERAAAAGVAEAREAVRLAVLDYVEGFYEGDTTRLRRSVWPGVRKYGYGRAPDGGAPYRGMAMAFPEGFVGYAGAVRAGRVRTPAGAPKEITVFDVQDQTASAKLVAHWGTDYLLLAREEGRWMITHVLWQSPPR